MKEQDRQAVIAKLEEWGVRLRAVVTGADTQSPTVAVYADIPYKIRNHLGITPVWLAERAIRPLDARTTPRAASLQDLPGDTLLFLLAEAASWRSDASRINRSLDEIGKLPVEEKRLSRIEPILGQAGLTLVGDPEQELRIEADGERWCAERAEYRTPNDLIELWLEYDCDDDDPIVGLSVIAPDKRLYEHELFEEALNPAHPTKRSGFSPRGDGRPQGNKGGEHATQSDPD